MDTKRNFRPGWFLIVTIVMLFIYQSSAMALKPDVLYAKLSPSIVDVLASGKDQKVYGSGVVIADERVVTNCHVLAKTNLILIKWEEAILVATLLYPDTERDLCELKVPSLKAPSVKIAPKKSLRVGQRVYAIGNPMTLERTFSDGLISSLRKMDNRDVIQTTAEITHGSSGGGLFDEEGRLVGITTAGLGEANINFAVPAYYIYDLPKRGKLAIKKLREEKSKGSKSSGQGTSADKTSASKSPTGHMLKGAEIAKYFAPHKRFSGTQVGGHAGFEIIFYENNYVRRECSNCHLDSDDGTMRIDYVNAKLCWDWNVAYYPNTGCFTVEQMSRNKFRLHLVGIKAGDIILTREN